MKALSGLPRLSLQLAGSALDAAELEALDAVRIQERLSLPAQCELTFVDPPAAFSERSLSAGASVLLAVDAGDTLFEGEVIAVELVFTAARQREVRVRAYDKLHRLRRKQPVRALAQITIGDLASQLAAEVGLSADAEDAGPQWPWIVQWRQTNLELLADLAMRAGLYLTLRGDVVHLVTLAGFGPKVELSVDDELLECSVELNGDGACNEVSAAGWDLGAVELHEERADSPRTAGAPAAHFVADTEGPWMLGDEPAPAAEHPKAAAQAELDRRAARAAILRGVADGDARLHPGVAVKLRGTPDTIADSYVLCSVNHVIDSRRGFVSELSTEPPPRPPRARATGAIAGRVTRLDGDNGRVKVELPSLGKVESDWLQVLAPGAGAGKGFVALPDVGDTVLVLLAHGDPAQGVVLGGLFGGSGPKDAGIVGGGIQRSTWRSAGGHVLRFDDEKHKLVIQDSSGNGLELSPDGVKLSAASGKRVVIRGNAIDFERG
jgi:uncharacterized protein involved in type VI secretion and phage assembly